MQGLSDYVAKNNLNWMTGLQAMPALPAVYAALFTAAPTAGAGTGGTEVSTSGTAYARQQCSGTLSLSASFTTSSTTLTLASTAPAWLLALGTVALPGNGVAIYDVTVSAYIGLIQSVSGTTVTLQAAAAHASSGSADSLNFSAFAQPAASTGSDPSIVAASSTTGAAINWPQATGAGFGSALFVGFYDAVTSGNFLGGDYLGNFPYLAASISSASPGVFTSHAHGYSAGNTVIATSKYGGAVPTFSQSNFTGSLLVVGPATDTFTVTNAGTAVNTSSSGDMMIRQVTVQSIPTGVTFTLAAGTSIAAA
jgi:hypothetical protein